MNFISLIPFVSKRNSSFDALISKNTQHHWRLLLQSAAAVQRWNSAAVDALLWPIPLCLPSDAPRLWDFSNPVRASVVPSLTWSSFFPRPTRLKSFHTPAPSAVICIRIHSCKMGFLSSLKQHLLDTCVRESDDDHNCPNYHVRFPDSTKSCNAAAVFLQVFVLCICCVDWIQLHLAPSSPQIKATWQNCEGSASGCTQCKYLFVFMAVHRFSPAECKYDGCTTAMKLCM